MLSNKILSLQCVSPKDAGLLATWRFSEENYDFFYEFVPTTKEHNEKWIENILNKKNELNLIAYEKENNRPVGMISLIDIDQRNQKCEIGRVLIGNAEDRKKGYGKHLLSLVLEYAFLHLNMRKVYLEVFADNASAVRFYEKAGFIQDGRFVKHIYKNGTFKDVLHMSLFKKESYPERSSL